jgi:glycosyltransferase involved in cell wall biosynthesis
MDKTLVFVNSTGDTFTPTHSGAIATWIWEMCRAARGFGIEPWVLTRNSSAQRYPWVRTIELEYPFPPQIRGVGRFCAWRAKRDGWAHIRQGRWVDRILKTVHSKGWERSILVFHNDPEMVAALRPKLRGACLVHLFHNANRCLSPWRELFSRSADLAMAVSRSCAQSNESHFGGAVQILRNGVDIKRFSPIPKPGNHRPVVGFVGRTDRQKAPDLLLRAALRIAKNFNKFDLQILGARFYGSHQSDPFQEMLKRSAGELEERGVHVEMPGFVSRLALPRILAKADIHVVPSRWEDPCPLTVLEGMATGQSIVASACGGIPEIVGSAGFLFQRDDLDGLEGRLLALLQSEELRHSYGVKARERAQERPWSKVFQELLEAINY